MTQSTIRPLDWGFLFLLSLLWGGSFFFSKIALTDLPPLTVVFCRVAMAAMALLFYMRATGREIPLRGTVWGTFLVMGALNNALPFSLLVWGQTQIASGLAAILVATTPVFSILVTKALIPETKVTANRLWGVLLGIVGVAVLVGFDATSDRGLAIWPMIACLGAALSYGFAGLWGQRFKRMGITPVAGAFGQLAASTCLMLPIVALVDRPWTFTMPGPVTFGAIAALALFSTAFAYVIFFRSLERIGQINTSMVTLMVPASAILLGCLILGETLTLNHCVGLVLIALGLLSIDGRVWQKLRI